MHELGWITDSEFSRSLNEIPLVYDETLTQNIAPYVVDEVVKRLLPFFPDLKKGGYKIYTTIDSKIQKFSKAALLKGYKNILKREKEEQNNTLNGAVVILKNNSGEILALNGGISYEKSSFNRATQAKRQPGSAFKPFIYQVALNLGYSPLSLIADVARTYEIKKGDTAQKWQPKNFEKDFKGIITLREALVHSRNLATINLVNEIGLINIHKELKNFGFKNLPLNLSLSLGNIAVSPLELAGFYTLFSNYGTKVKPFLILKIIDKNNKTVFSRKKEFLEIEPKKQAYLIIDILKDVVKRGTGRKAFLRNIEIAGKTGTTNNNIDAWFCGFSPQYEVVVWYGKDNNAPMGKREVGGIAAAPVVGEIFRYILEIHPETKRKFYIPKGVKFATFGDKKEIFTSISKLPKANSEKSEKEEILLF
jgi:penicillin-binding protein 1A